ncbi:nitroreductase family protein [bacterium]|nr:nitroreductase family protein [bacterium]
MYNLKFTVDKEKCIKCGLCQKDCISKIIQTDTDGYPCVKDETFCISCQHCLAVCPKGAISVFGKNPDNSDEINNTISPEQLENLIKARRSYRIFKQENIDSETMNKLKNILNWAPTGVNFRDLRFTIVENKDTMVEIKETLYKKLKFLFKFIPLKKSLQPFKQAILDGNDVIFRNAPHMIVVSTNKKAPCKEIDPIIALSYFELYAQSLGIGTLWCGFAYKTLPFSKEVMKKLEIPKTHKLSYVMLFGKPDIKYQRAIQPDNHKITVL